MKTPASPDHPLPPQARQVTLWARRYLQTRNMGMLIALFIMIPLYLVGTGVSLLLGWAIHFHNLPLVCVSTVGEIVWLVVLVYFSVPRWGGQLVSRLAAHYYQPEGTANLADSTPRRRPKWVLAVAGGLFVLCILGTSALGSLGVITIPDKYMQPVSALYCVPFLVLLWWWQRPQVSPVSLLWPILYALHAILIVAGAPILFMGRYESFNMYLPVFGYGLLAGIAVHIFNRLALRRLQRAARQGL